MDKSLIFNSIDRPVPPVRRNLNLIPFQDEDREFLYFQDTFGYVKEGFALDQKVAPILSLLSGEHSVNQIVKILKGGIQKEELLSFVSFLDENLLLESPYFNHQSDKIENEFEKSSNRASTLAGQSYPDSEKKLDDYLNTLFKKNGQAHAPPIKALYAPHIEMRIGESNYSKAFSSLKKVKPKRVVILATSHYSGIYGDRYQNYPFVGSYKSYQIPGRTFSTDNHFIKQLEKTGEENGFTTADRAHRLEHSIETHLVMASHIWKHDFSIVPILIGGFDELFYMSNGDLTNKIDSFVEELRELDDEDTFYLISGDLSHIGVKFGDKQPAREMRASVEKFDDKFLEIAGNNRPDEMLQHVSENYDPYRICGFPPLYTFLKLFPELKGQKISYDWWDESERDSAVSFGSITF